MLSFRLPRQSRRCGILQRHHRSWQAGFLADKAGNRNVTKWSTRDRIKESSIGECRLKGVAMMREQAGPVCGEISADACSDPC